MPVDLIARRARLADGSLQDLAIDGGRFVAVAADLGLEGGRSFDLGGAAVLPGLVDLHQHIDRAYTLAEGSADDDLDQAIEAARRLARGMTAADVVRRGREVYRRMMRSGTCAVRTHAAVDDTVSLRAVEGLVELRDEFADRVRTQIVAMPRGDVDLRDPTEANRLRAAVRLGCEVLGGAPSRSSDPPRYIDAVLDLAWELGCLVDLHVDEDQIADASVLAYLARATVQRGLAGRVAAGHCCTLAVIPDPVADEVIDWMGRAALHVSTCPLTNLYLQGGGGRVPGFRGMTRVRDLLAAGINVCCGSDNIRDPFNPYGNGDLILAALIAGLACRMGSAADQASLLASVTSSAARAMGYDRDYGLRVGARADLVAFDCPNAGAILADQPRRRLVVLGGVAVAGDALAQGARPCGA